MELKHKGFTIITNCDNDPISPRELFNQTIIYSNHREYNPDDSKLSELMAVYDVDDVESLTEKLTAENVKFVKVYAYIHGGISLSIGAPSVNDKFDTGLFGIMTLDEPYVDEATIEDPAAVQSIFENEIKELNQYYNGEVYAYHIISDEGEMVSFRGGFFGEDAAMEAAKEEVDEIVEENEEVLNSAEIPTSHLRNVFYKYATEAPSWVDEIMDLVTECELRKLLRSKIKEMLSESEIRSEFSQFA